MYQPEQELALSKITEAAKSDQNIEALYLFGSWRTETADSWSDLDLMAIVRTTTLCWLPELGPLFAQDQDSDVRGDLFRLVYNNGLCIDLLCVTPESAKSINSWPRIPFGKGIRPLINGCKHYDKYVLSAQPTAGLPTIEALREHIDSLRFIAIQALKKQVRNDQLVAEHLALETLQESMVCAMIARELSSDFQEPDFLKHRHDGVAEMVLFATATADKIGNIFLENYECCTETVRHFCHAQPNT